MTLITYREQRFSLNVLEVISQAQVIISEYQDQGFSLTLRQLYYQFVSRDLIPNNLRSYKRLGDVVNNARMAGYISWDAIEDRTRNMTDWQHFDGPREAIEQARSGYFIDRWDNQPCRVVVLIEKDALVGVIEGVCNEYDVPFMACRGYMSQSEQWRLGRRLADYRERGQTPIVLHLGDHDPSGIDMTRDNVDRLALFADEEVEVRRLALNYDQVERYRPPPNPTKFTDSRARGYIREFGRSCWELDALEPRVIVALLRAELAALVDDDLWAETAERQQDERGVLDRFIEQLED